MAGSKLSCGKAGAYLIVALLSVGLGGCLGTAETDPRAREVTVTPIGPRPIQEQAAMTTMTREELEEEIRRFADRFGSRLGLAADQILEKSSTARQRTVAHWLGTGCYASAVDIAIGPNAVANLFDMLVLASLNRMAVETYWVPEVFGQELGQDLILASRTLEEDIWTVSEKVLTPDQQEDLRALIRAWYEQHPEQHNVWGIRFGEFSGQRAAELDRVIKSGGLLGQVQQTREAVDEVRFLGERVLYYMQRAPFLVRAQVSLGVARVTDEPEIAGALEDWQRVSKSMERVAEQVEQLPEQRIEAIEQFMEGLDQQRSAFMEDLVSHEDEFRNVLGDLHETLTAASELVALADSLAARFQIGDPNMEPFDPNLYSPVLAQTGDTVVDLSGLLQAVEELLASPAWEQRVPDAVGLADEIGADVEGLLNRVFLLAAGLIVVLFAALFLCRLASVRLTGR
jgi:hypothetical protein